MATTANEKDEFKGFQIPNIDTTSMLESYKKNLEILGLVNKMSVEVLNGIAKLQAAYVKQMMADMSSIAEKSTRPSEALAEISRVARDSTVRAIGNGKQISDLLQMASNDITTATAKRVRETMEEAKSVMNGKK